METVIATQFVINIVPQPYPDYQNYSLASANINISTMRLAKSTCMYMNIRSTCGQLCTLQSIFKRQGRSVKKKNKGGKKAIEDALSLVGQPTQFKAEMKTPVLKSPLRLAHKQRQMLR